MAEFVVMSGFASTDLSAQASKEGSEKIYLVSGRSYCANPPLENVHVLIQCDKHSAKQLFGIGCRLALTRIGIEGERPLYSAEPVRRPKAGERITTSDEYWEQPIKGRCDFC